MTAKLRIREKERVRKLLIRARNLKYYPYCSIGAHLSCIEILPVRVQTLTHTHEFIEGNKRTGTLPFTENMIKNLCSVRIRGIYTSRSHNVWTSGKVFFFLRREEKPCSIFFRCVSCSGCFCWFSCGKLKTNRKQKWVNQGELKGMEGRSSRNIFCCH